MGKICPYCHLMCYIVRDVSMDRWGEGSFARVSPEASLLRGRRAWVGIEDCNGLDVQIVQVKNIICIQNQVEEKQMWNEPSSNPSLHTWEKWQADALVDAQPGVWAVHDIAVWLVKLGTRIHEPVVSLDPLVVVHTLITLDATRWGKGDVEYRWLIDCCLVW